MVQKTLAVAMDSIVNFMKAVEIKEQAAEQAKEDATRGCSDVLAKVDEVKHALSRAKEANDMVGSCSLYFGFIISRQYTYLFAIVLALWRS